MANARDKSTVKVGENILNNNPKSNFNISNNKT